MLLKQLLLVMVLVAIRDDSSDVRGRGPAEAVVGTQVSMCSKFTG